MNEKVFSFKIINSRHPKIILWVAMILSRVGRNTACKESRREIPEAEGNGMVCREEHQRKRKFQASEVDL